MRRTHTLRSLLLVGALGWGFAGCVPGGDPAADEKASSLRAALTASGSSGSGGGSGGETPAERLARLRAEIAAKGYTFTVGFSEAFFRPISELAGTVAPPDIAERVRRQNNPEPPEPGVTAALAAAVPPCSTAAAAFDWRPAKIVTPVRNQGGCGSCWAFSSLAAFEAVYALRNPINMRVSWESANNLHTSEQDALSCSGGGTCAGGWFDGVYNFVFGGGVARLSRYPYTATDSACNAALSRPTPSPVAPVGGTFRYLSDVIDPGFATQRIATDAETKAALCQFGPLSTTALVTPLFQGYTSGVFNEAVDAATLTPTDPGTGLKNFNVNHGVAIIGWNDADNTWLIKNSWGTTWGEAGFMRISRAANNINWMSISLSPVPGR